MGDDSTAAARREPRLERRGLARAAAAGDPGKRLGTFAGVFTPSILTILGIILFLRLGYVVGQAGLSRALVILAIATLISTLTTISLAAVATNRKVQAGGDYYLISRSLGVSFGGALGLMLFSAQAVSIAFYCAGFGEAVAAMLPEYGGVQVPASIGALVVLLAIAYAGADLATRFQYVVMAVLVGALASFFGGGVTAWDPARLAANWAASGSGQPFWVLFAIFFPAVTGFTQGVSMSGELRDPRHSLPRGTFAAVGLSTVVYLAAMLVLAAGAPPAELSSDYSIMRRIAAFEQFVDAGVLAATLSSALASFLGAPRILQAVAADGIFPFLQPFAQTSAGNPRRAVLLAGAIALVTLAFGHMNAIARLVSMFFLISYGLLNYATYIEATGNSPSFRPRLRFSTARTSLAGTLCCAGAMLAIDARAGVLALAILAALYQYVERTALPYRWRDSWDAYRLRRIRQDILELADGNGADRDWQPHILVFTETPERRARLLRFASWISGGAGITAAVQLVESDGTRRGARAQCAVAETALRAELEREDIEAFPLAVATTDLPLSAGTLVQAWGIGPIRANTILLNWVERFAADREASDDYVQLLRGALRLDRHVVVLNARSEDFGRIENMESDRRCIDVWWWNDASSNLALLLAYLMTRTSFWDEATIRLLVPAPAAEAEAISERVVAHLKEVRIDVQVELVIGGDPGAVAAHSRDSTITFLPLRFSDGRVVGPFGAPLAELLLALPAVALVGAATDIGLSEPEERPVAPPASEPDSG